MLCPKCKIKTTVIDSRSDGEIVARRRVCKKCGYKVHTLESTKFGDEAWYEVYKKLQMQGKVR
jgi:transcriptional regulator NrdR family protein